MNLQENPLDVMYEPLAGSNLTNLLRLLAQNNFRIGLKYLPRTLYALALSGFISPFRLRERLHHEERVRATSIERDPLFILGHWRSGTTYLHNVFSLDPSFGYCSTFQATVPGVFLASERRIKPILAASIPDKRPMDDAPMGTDLPQEEEYAMGAFTPYAYYNGWCFPRSMARYNQFVTLDGMPAHVVSEWQETYRYLLRKLTLRHGGRRLVLKNPSNTARIDLLLAMFPDAQFVHIHRNPYTLYASMMKFLRIVLPRYCVQNPPPVEEIEDRMMDLYVRMYRKYLVTRGKIPEGNLIEIRYEEFVEHPEREIARVYDALRLPDFNRIRSQVCAFVETQRGIRRGTYALDDETKKAIYDRWSFAFDAFGYEP
jgi:hypothetical protein